MANGMKGTILHLDLSGLYDANDCKSNWTSKVVKRIVSFVVVQCVILVLGTETNWLKHNLERGM